MGKKARKLRSPKYANKASALRDTFARLRGQITETVETVVETVTKQVIVAAEKAEQVLDQTQERVNALRFTNENEAVQAKGYTSGHKKHKYHKKEFYFYNS